MALSGNYLKSIIEIACKAHFFLNNYEIFKFKLRMGSHYPRENYTFSHLNDDMKYLIGFFPNFYSLHR